MNETMKINIDNDEFNLLILSAFRYAITRQSYIVSVVAEVIYRNRDKLNKQTIKNIISEIEEYKAKGIERYPLTTYEFNTWLELQYKLKYKEEGEQNNEI